MAPIPRILIVEDDEIISHLIAIMLEPNGYSIAGKVGSGEEAVIKAADLEPDLILMDISLTGNMDGVTAAQYIFQLFRMPVVFLTAHYDEELLERAKTAQPLGYILKPFTDKELVSNVELALNNHNFRKKYLDAFPIGEPRQIMESLALVLFLDTQGRIVFHNPCTVRFLGLSEKEILGHHWQEVMTLVNDQTGEEIPDPVPEVVRNRIEITCESGTAVVTKSGKSEKVGVTVRPVKDEKHELIGVFMQIREKTPDLIRMAAGK